MSVIDIGKQTDNEELCSIISKWQTQCVYFATYGVNKPCMNNTNTKLSHSTIDDFQWLMITQGYDIMYCVQIKYLIQIDLIDIQIDYIF